MSKRIITLVIISIISIFIFTLCKEDSLVELITNTYNYIIIDDISPAGSELNVPKNASIAIQFSQPIQSDTFNQSFFLSSNNGKVDLSNYTINWSNDKTLVTLSSPVTELAGDTIYSVTVNSNIRSTSGNPLQSEYYSTFVTGDFADSVPPQILSYTLNQGSDNLTGTNINGATVYPLSNFKLVFNDTMVRSSTQNAFQLLVNGTQAAPSNISWSNTTLSGDTVVFTFANVNQNASCTINLTNNALDKGGNGVTNPINNLNFFAGSATGVDIHESNDNTATATPLTLNKLESANISPAGDPDWYVVTLNGSESYNINLANVPASVNYDFEYYSPGPTSIGIISSAGNGGSETLANWTPPLAGSNQYYIRVHALNGSDTHLDSYSIVVEQITADSYETDNTFANANTVGVGSTHTDHTLHIAGDEDFYTFSATTNTTYNINLTNVPAGCDYDIVVYEPDQVTTAESSTTGGVAGDETISFTADNTGNYYIKVYVKASYSGSTSNYSLTISSSTGIDYSITSDTNPGTAATGNAIAGIDFTIQNGGGTADSGSVDWYIYLSTDTAIDAGDTIVGSGTFAGLASGDSQTVSTSMGTFPATPGTVYLLAKVVPDSDTNTNNNNRTSTVNVIGNVDYQVMNVTMSAGPYYSGNATADSVSGSFQIYNAGSNNGVDRSISIYLSDSSTGATNLGGSFTITPTSSGVINAGNTSTYTFTGTFPVSTQGTNRYLAVKLTTGTDSDSNNDYAVSNSFELKLLASPSIDTVTNQTYESFIKVTWTDIDGEDIYEIRRSDDGGSIFNTIANVSAGTISYDDYSASAARHEYHYALRCKRNNGASSTEGNTLTGAKNGLLLFKEDFQSYTVAETNPGSWVSSGVATMEIKSFGPNDKCLQLITSGGTGGTSLTISSAKKPSYVSYYRYISGTSIVTGDVYIGDSAPTAASAFASRFDSNAQTFGSNGDIYSYNSLSSKNIWYKIEYKNINWTNHTCDTYVDGVLVGSNKDFYQTTCNELDNISFVHPYDGGNSYIDEIEMRY